MRKRKRIERSFEENGEGRRPDSYRGGGGTDRCSMRKTNDARELRAVDESEVQKLTATEGIPGDS